MRFEGEKSRAENSQSACEQLVDGPLFLRIISRESPQQYTRLFTISCVYSRQNNFTLHWDWKDTETHTHTHAHTHTHSFSMFYYIHFIRTSSDLHQYNLDVSRRDNQLHIKTGVRYNLHEAQRPLLKTNKSNLYQAFQLWSQDSDFKCWH